MSYSFRRMPDGTLTDDVDLYANTWKALCLELEKALGLKVTSCNPGFCVIEDDLTHIIPFFVAERILKLYRRSK